MKLSALGLFVCSASFLAACGGHQKGYAPKPPEFHSASASSLAEDLANISPAAGSTMAGELDRAHMATSGQILAMKAEQARANCRFKDRFDRDDLIAYEWGQNRLGLDVDGIGYDSMELEEVKLTFSMNLQPIKSKKQLCRRDTSWQGMIGSGYNELIVHDGAVIEQKYNELRSEIDDRIGYFVD